jgi:adenylosuccinate lyase
MSLHAISPIDGRYYSKTESLSPYFSEYALIKERCRVEIEYLIALHDLALPHMPRLTKDQIVGLREIIPAFKESDAVQIKEIEKKTNHDVKAVEYFLKEKLVASGMTDLKEWIHFGLTSQDINNTAVPILTYRAVKEVMLIELNNVIRQLTEFASSWRNDAMLAHTHGQPATPTTMGKELAVFAERLLLQREGIAEHKYYGKFGGATGNLNAHKVAYPDIDWPQFADKFVVSLGLIREKTTTQIDHYDHLASLFHGWMRINTILMDLCRDIWQYISMEYLAQHSVPGEVGSSTMPHKVNPIDFENAEGNLGIANALFSHLADKLPISRLQRDLTDSTALRNIGVPFAHTLIALTSLLKGFNKITLNKTKLSQDLDDQWIVLAEAIQTVLRREGIPEPYELLKGLTRGTGKITREDLWLFVDSLGVSENVKNELKSLTPHNYIGFV